MHVGWCIALERVLHTEVSFIQSVLYQRFHCVSIHLCGLLYMHVYYLSVDLYTIAFSGLEPIPPAAFNPDQCHQELVEYYHCHMRPSGEPILIPVVQNTNTVSQQQHCSRYIHMYRHLHVFEVMHICMVFS